MEFQHPYEGRSSSESVLHCLHDLDELQLRYYGDSVKAGRCGLRRREGPRRTMQIRPLTATDSPGVAALDVF